MTKKTAKKSTVITIRIATVVLLSLIVVLTGVGIYFSLNKKKPVQPDMVVNPLDFATDTWDGETEDNSSFLSGDKLGNRGERVYTINSASSFVYFVNLVNDEDRAKEYDYFRNYTIYLNSNIDLAGYSIQSIGKQITENGVTTSTFQGTFNGAYYSILNANIVGNGLFGYIENANIQNIGLYNSTIDSTETYTGSIAGIAINTNISNTYVRLGSTKGSMVGGLVGAYISTNGTRSISNSFVDNTIIGDRVGALIGYLDTNHTSENAVTISNVYYTQNIDSINTLFYEGTLEENFVTLTNVIYATDISQFSTWNYTSEYSANSDWCDYAYRENSTALDFRFPIQSGFVKVFLNGSYIENTVTINGETTDSSTLAESFNQVNANDTAEVHIIVEKVYVEEEAVAKANATLTVTPDVTTTLVRSEGNSENLIVGSSNSQLYIGEEEAQINTPKITLDGNIDHVKSNNQQSGALIYAQGEDLIVGSNVILQNNINNTTGYGGAISMYKMSKIVNEETGEVKASKILANISNCEAENGGALSIINSSVEIANGDITNCRAENGGGAIYYKLAPNENEAKTILMSTYLKYGGNQIQTTSGEIQIVIDSEEQMRIQSQDFTGCASDNGGAIFFEILSTEATYPYYPEADMIFADIIIASCNFFENYAELHGGAIYINADSKSETYSRLRIGNCRFEMNFAEQGSGGAVYFLTTNLRMGGPQYDAFRLEFEICEFINNEAHGNIGGGAVFLVAQYYYRATNKYEHVLAGPNCVLEVGDDDLDAGLDYDVLRDEYLGYYCRFVGFKSCSFYENLAYGNGGAIYCRNLDLVTQETEIADNEASNKGGGILIQGGQGYLLWGTAIHDNNAHELAGDSNLYLMFSYAETSAAIGSYWMRVWLVGEIYYTGGGENYISYGVAYETDFTSGYSGYCLDYVISTRDLSDYSKSGYTATRFAYEGSGHMTGIDWTRTEACPNYKVVYTPNTYKVTFNANGGSVSQTSKTVTYDSTYGTLPTPTKSGAEFLGWYTTQTGGSLVTSSTTVRKASNHTLYASWGHYVTLGGTNHIGYPYTVAGWNKITGTSSSSVSGNEELLTIRITSTASGGPWLGLDSRLTVGKEYTWTIDIRTSRTIAINELGHE